MTTTHTRTQRLTATALSLSAAFAMGCFFPAAAVQVLGAPTTSVSAPAVNETATSLSITLSRGNPDLGHPELQGIVSGVTVKLEKLEGIDPFSPADVEKISKTNFDDILFSWAKADPLTAVTDTNGRVTFNNLSKGIYLVTSTAPTQDGTYRRIEPMLVAMPYLGTNNNVENGKAVIIAKTRPDLPPDDFGGSTTPPTPTTPATPRTPPTAPNIPGIPSFPWDEPNQTPTRPQPTPPPPPSVPGAPADEKNAPPAITVSTPIGELALTGVQVLGVAAGALALVASGLILIVFSRRRAQKVSD